MLNDREKDRIWAEEKRRMHEDQEREKARTELRMQQYLEENKPKPRYIHAFTAGMIALIFVAAAFSQAHIPVGVSVLVSIVVGALVFRKVL